ncbi:hypothetical protein [Paracoccus denitrificans]|uniref:hypothetical protein n=1 Tax=Paracoccus denitrificans TaxID=266 RepID=UPI0033651DD5
MDRDHVFTEPSDEQLAAHDAENLQSVLTHLRDNPTDDAECFLEVKVSMSALAKMQLRSIQEKTSLQAVLTESLRRDGLS